MQRTLFAFALLALLPGVATVHAQTGLLILEKSNIDNDYLFGPGTFTRTQRVLSAANPSLAGSGRKRTVILCDDAATTGPFVTVDNYGSGTDSDGRLAEVSNVTLDGTEVMPTTLYGHGSDEFDLSAFGVSVDSDCVGTDGEMPATRDTLIQNFRGYGVKSRGASGEVSRVRCKRVYVGYFLTASDTALTHCFAENTRDCGVFLPSTGGNFQTTQVHCFGSRIAFYDQGAYGWRSLNDTMADSLIGLYAEFGGHTQQITNALLQHNLLRDALIRSHQATLNNCNIDVALKSTTYAPIGMTHGTLAGEFYPGPTISGKYGIETQADYTNLNNCRVTLGSYQHAVWGACVAADAAIWLNDHQWIGGAFTDHTRNANMFRFTGQLIDADGVSGSKGIRVTGTKFGARVDVGVGREHSSDLFNFQHADDRVLVVDATAVMKDCQFVFRGSQSDLISNVGKYIDVPDGWKPVGSNNSITVIRSDTGAVLELENQEY